MICDYLRVYTPKREAATRITNQWGGKFWVQKNGYKVQLSGKDLLWLEPDEEIDLANFALKYGKITRFDIAFDIYTDFDLLKWYNMIYSIHPKLRILHNATGGCTVYYGKRYSAFLLRVYRKDIEIMEKTGIDIGDDIVRVELECKRRLAIPAARAFANGNEELIRGWIAAKLSLPFWGDACAMALPKCALRKHADVWQTVHRYRKAIRTAMNLDEKRFKEIINEK